jgi:hypothetical protein
MNDGLFSLLYIDPPTAVGGSAQDKTNDFHWNFTKKHIPEMIQLLKDQNIYAPLVWTALTYKSFSLFRNKWNFFLRFVDPTALNYLVSYEAIAYSFFFWFVTVKLHKTHPKTTERVITAIGLTILSLLNDAKALSIKTGARVMSATIDMVTKNGPGAWQAVKDAWQAQTLGGEADKRETVAREEAAREEAAREEAKQTAARKKAENDAIHEEKLKALKENQLKLEADIEEQKAKAQLADAERINKELKEQLKEINRKKFAESLQQTKQSSNEIQLEIREIRASQENKPNKLLKNIKSIADSMKHLLDLYHTAQSALPRHLQVAPSWMIGASNAYSLANSYLASNTQPQTQEQAHGSQEPQLTLPAKPLPAKGSPAANTRAKTKSSTRMFSPNSSAAEDMTESEYTAFLKEINGALDSIVFV